MPRRSGYMLHSRQRRNAPHRTDRRESAVASLSPLHIIQDLVVGTIKGVTHPVGTAGKAVHQVKDTVALGRSVAGAAIGLVPGVRHSPTVTPVRPVAPVMPLADVP